MVPYERQFESYDSVGNAYYSLVFPHLSFSTRTSRVLIALLILDIQYLYCRVKSLPCWNIVANFSTCNVADMFVSVGLEMKSTKSGDVLCTLLNKWQHWAEREPRGCRRQTWAASDSAITPNWLSIANDQFMQSKSMALLPRSAAPRRARLRVGSLSPLSFKWLSFRVCISTDETKTKDYSKHTAI